MVFLLGLILVLVVVLVTVAVVTAGDDPAVLHLHWFTIHTDGTQLFVAGAATSLLALISLWVLRAGVRRARRRRHEIRDLRRQAGATRTTSGSTAPPSSRPVGSPAPSADDADGSFDTAPRG